MESKNMVLVVEPEGAPQTAAVLVTEECLAAVLGTGPLEARGVRSGAMLTSVAMVSRREVFVAVQDAPPGVDGYPCPVILHGPGGCGAPASLPPYLMEAYQRALKSHGSGLLRDGGLGTIVFSGCGQASMIGRRRLPVHVSGEGGVLV